MKVVSKQAVSSRVAAVLQLFLELDESQFSSMISVLATSRFITSQQSVLEQLEVNSAGTSRDDLRDMLGFAMGVLVAAGRDDIALSDYPSLMAKAPNLKMTPDERSILESRLRIVFDSRGLRSLAKAITLEGAHLDVFQNASIVSDMRPVFPIGDDDPTELPGGFIIWHSLRIESSRGSRAHVHEFALDVGDLERIRVQVERAIHKQRVLERFSAGVGLAIWESEVSEND